MNQYAKQGGKKDALQPTIVNALRGRGASVIVIHRPCDLIVGYGGHTLLVEIKSPPDISHRSKKKELSPEQIEFRATWRGAPVHVIRRLEDIGPLLEAHR